MEFKIIMGGRFMEKEVQVSLLTESELASPDIERSIYELNVKLESLKPHGDQLDYFVSAASGVLCAMADILWVGEFDLSQGREMASEQVDNFVIKVARMMGSKSDNVGDCVRLLEKFAIPSDGNTPEFGGGLQHHLRDFAHHPTPTGLIFSLTTQFTGMSYGTDTAGNFIHVNVTDKSMGYIGDSIPDKIIKGVLIWMLHLVSDMAGSSATAGLGGGTGIPGPILSMLKELSTLPFFKNLKADDKTFSEFLSKLFNGTLLAQHDEKGKIIPDTRLRFDFRAELGILDELGKQAIPVIANECFVRIFYFIRRLYNKMKEKEVRTLDDFKKIDWDDVKPYNNPTLTRMLTIATGVFTTLDIAEAVVTEKYWVSVNYVGVGRFTLALAAEAKGMLKRRDIEQLRKMYEEIDANVYRKAKEIFSLDIQQTEILYNLECHKIMNDIRQSKKDKKLKTEWLQDYKKYISQGFSDFCRDENAEIHWLDIKELHDKIKDMFPEKPWLREILLEVTLFEPYFALSTIKDKKGNEKKDTKYDSLKIDWKKADEFLDNYFYEYFYLKGYASKFRKCYEHIINELMVNNLAKVGKAAVAVGVGAIGAVATSAFAPQIAVALVGSLFTGLHGAALTSASLAFLGGGALTAGGYGVAGGTLIIIGGGTILSSAAGAGAALVSDTVINTIAKADSKQILNQVSKLMVSIYEIVLNDERDVIGAEMLLNKHVQTLAQLQKELVDRKLELEFADKKSIPVLKKKIKNMEKSIDVLISSMRNMKKYISSYKEGLKKEAELFA